MHKEKETAKTLSKEEIEKLFKDASLVLATTRMNFIKDFPFAGNVSMSLDLVPTRDSRNPTAATDGRNLFFDIDFLSSLSENERMFVIGHEVYHNVLMHFARTEGRDRQLFNIATDLEVNHILRADGMSVPGGALLAEQFGFPAGLSAEEYYEMLLQNPSNLQQKLNSLQNSGSGSPSGSGSQSQRNQSPVNGQFDKHVYEGDEMSKEKGPNGMADKYGKLGEDPNFNPSLDKQTMERIREAAVRAAQEIERQRGDLPAHLKKLINSLTEPEVNWKEVLSQFASKCVTNDPTWNRPNRRFAHMGTFLPSHEGKMIKMAIGLDTSGSTAGDINKFLSEVHGIVTTFGNYEVDLIQCDCDIQDVAHYDDSQPLDLINNHFEAKGFGGTRMKPVFDYVAVNDLQPDVLVMFTDGYIESNLTEAPQYPVLWVLTPDSTDSNIHFGEVVKFQK